jgi:hypothetical protein
MGFLQALQVEYCTKTQSFEISDSHSSADEDTCLLEHDFLLTATDFWMNLLPPLSDSKLLQSTVNYLPVQSMWCHISEDLNLQKHDLHSLQHDETEKDIFSPP